MSYGSTAMGYAWNSLVHSPLTNHIFAETAEGKVNRTNAAAFAAAAAAGVAAGPPGD
jgi:hypothetical protein